MDNKTIYALSTTFGKSGVAVIRISGAKAKSVISQMTSLDEQSIKPRYAYFIDLQDINHQCTIDKCLLLYFKAPCSFTGEDIVELQTHGSKAVIKSVLENLSQLPSFRMAEAGEFSKRAFYNGKMDLTEAEGLADLIDAETSVQQKYAIRQMEGNLKNLYEEWRSSFVEIMAYLEAFIDFPDEEIPHDVVEKINNTVFKLKSAINQHLSSDNIGERLREGFRVVIVGRPNAGKSSLLNAIAQRDVVIVSDIEGTTRDAIDIHLDVKGYPVTITDTAGIRETEEAIEKQGVEIALQKIKDADLLLCLYDAQNDTPDVFANIAKEFAEKMIYVANKQDKLTNVQIKQIKDKNITLISAKSHDGVDKIMNKIAEIIDDMFTENSSLLITRTRYREALSEALNALNMFSLDKEIELSAEDIRLAARELGKITGRIEVDEILDKIFGSFCIGK